MICVEAPSLALSFKVNMIFNRKQLDNCKTLVISAIDPKKDTVTDYVFNDPILTVSKNSIVINGSSEVLSLFGLVSFINPESERLIEVFLSYDGFIFAYTNSNIIFSSYLDGFSSILDQDKEKNEVAYVVTGY